jgi:hypothetical protein
LPTLVLARAIILAPSLEDGPAEVATPAGSPIVGSCPPEAFWGCLT